MLPSMATAIYKDDSADELRVRHEDGICTITLARPAKKNAFTNAMYASMADALASLDEMQARCVVLQADGDAFSAGNDLNDFLSLEGFTEATAPVVRVLNSLATLDVPIIAAVDGPAVGIGTTLLLHCDLVFATSRARFAAPFVPLGLVPEAASSRLLPELIGYRRAMAMFLLGEFLDADAALASGLVSHLSEKGELLSQARAAATRVAALPVDAVRATRRLCRMEPASIADTIDREVEAFGARLKTEDTRRAIKSVLQARSSGRSTKA